VRTALVVIKYCSPLPHVPVVLGHAISLLTDTGSRQQAFGRNRAGGLLLLTATGWATPVAILRSIDAEGREKDVSDVNHLYELIQERSISFDSLIWDDEQRRWVAARDHEFFRRIREIAAAAPTAHTTLLPWPRAPSSQPMQPAAPAPQIYKSPLMQHKNAGLDEAVSVADTPRSKWFKPIHTREEALKTIKDSSSAFFFVAALQGAIGMWLATQYPDLGFDVGETVIEVTIYTAFAAWLRWGRSRTAAVILLLMATVALGIGYDRWCAAKNYSRRQKYLACADCLMGRGKGGRGHIQIAGAV
jgi:hypothetical protein